MLANNQNAKQSILNLPCPNCGSQLSYSAEKEMISCKHCDFSKDYEKSNDLVKELSLSFAEENKQKFSPSENDKKVIDCQGCGAQLMIDNTEVSIRCNFCGSEKVNEKAYNENIIQPQGILPFKIDKRESVDKFKVWIKKGWFHPNKLKKLASMEDIHGIYVPFWTFDSNSYSEWSGEAGYHYYETEQVYENGKYVSKQVRKTRWVWKQGSFNEHFDDLLILASKGLPEKIIEKIYPYNLNEVVNHSNELVVGWEAEIYSLGVKDGYSKAEEKMHQAIRSRASGELGGDTQRGLTVDSDFYDQTFKHLILPVWLCSYRFNNKTFQFAVNGQTGKINGQKPISAIKVILFVLLILTIIMATYFIIQQYNN